uniref:Uncharacterized protein n=1 Tax=viral metagenome TaxID=1070528 RepID=A0A6C0KVB9_9ZZZZ
MTNIKRENKSFARQELNNTLVVYQDVWKPKFFKQCLNVMKGHQEFLDDSPSLSLDF